ncbi:MAG: hypothetical protein AAF675_14260 [Pseudomonadota bacterium]
MKAFLMAVVAAAVISVGAWYGLNEVLPWSSADAFQKSDSVRLDPDSLLPIQ